MTLIFFSLAVFWLHFGTFEGSEWVFSVPGSKINTLRTGVRYIRTLISA